MRKLVIRIVLVTAVLIAGVLLIFGSAIRRLFTPTDTVVARVRQDVVTLKEADALIDYDLINSGYTRQFIAREFRESLADTYSHELNNRVMLKLYMLKAEEMHIFPLRQTDNLVAFAWATLHYEQNPARMAAAGITREEAIQIEREKKVADILKEEVTKNIAVTDAEVRAIYDDQLARQKERFTKNPSQYQFDQRYPPETVIVYRPQELRVVQHVLIPFPQDVAYQIITESYPEEKKKLMDIYTLKIQAQAENILDRAKQSQDFDALMAVTLQNHNPCGDELNYFYMKSKYELGKDFDFDTGLLNAAFALKNLGDMTGLVPTEYGYHILKWVGTEPAGPIPFEEVKGAITDQIIKSKKDAVWKAAVDQWTAEANIEEYPGRMP